MKRLVLAAGIFGEICALARRYRGEFAVTLFGKVQDQDWCVSHIAPPGKNAVSKYAECTGDEEFETELFHNLRAADPGIQWLGDLHAHPAGCTRLSATDRITIRKILLGSDTTLHPEEYVAGILLRREAKVEIWPMHFNRVNLTGSPMEVIYEHLRQEPERT